MDFPVILDMESPRVNAYSLETSIAEKLEAIIHNGYFNSRYKDFYDIYDLSKPTNLSQPGFYGGRAASAGFAEASTHEK